MVTTIPFDDNTGWLINYLQGDYPFMPVNARYYYCNNGWMLLSEALHRITGTNFSTALDSMLFTPLGMNSSSFLYNKQNIYDRLAVSYDATGARYLPAALSPAWSGRTNRVYRMLDLHPYDYFWNMASSKTLRLTTKDGALLTDWVLTKSVAEPQHDNLAFQRGVHYRKGGAIRISICPDPGYRIRRRGDNNASR